MEQRNPRLRWLVVWVLAVVWILAVLARLSYLQLFSYSEYLAKAQHQQQRIFEISPMRGTIYDRKGRELAVSIPMDSVLGDPAVITDVIMVAGILSPAIDTPAEEIETKIREALTPVRLAKKLSPDIVQRIGDMNLRGVFFQKENRRVYPQHDLAAQVLGYVDVDEKGIGGIEYSLDQQIRGRPGKIMVMADGRRRWYDRRESAADPGAAVDLTIDETIQYIAEKELARAVQDATKARSPGPWLGTGPEQRRVAGCCKLSDIRSERRGKIFSRRENGSRGERGIRARLNVQGDHRHGSD